MTLNDRIVDVEIIVVAGTGSIGRKILRIMTENEPKIDAILTTDFARLKHTLWTSYGQKVVSYIVILLSIEIIPHLHLASNSICGSTDHKRCPIFIEFWFIFASCFFLIFRDYFIKPISVVILSYQRLPEVTYFPYLPIVSIFPNENTKKMGALDAWKATPLPSPLPGPPGTYPYSRRAFFRGGSIYYIFLLYPNVSILTPAEHIDNGLRHCDSIIGNRIK